MSAKAIAGIDVVIVDVLRATTTIAYAVSRGASVLPLADEHEALARGAELGDRAILVGEHMGRRLPGFHCNNSKAELAAHELAGKTVVITTTNGTKAVVACAGAHRVIAGAITNAGAVGRFLRGDDRHRAPLEGRCDQRDVAIVCAGRSTGALALEDLLGAGAIAAAIAAHSDVWLADGTRVAHDVFVRARDDLAAAIRSSDAAQDLIEQGNVADVIDAAVHDAHASVPVLQGAMFVAAGT